MSDEKILVVDDDPMILTGIKRLLSSEYDMVFANGPIEALEAFGDGADFGVVVSDMRMPEMTGIDMLLQVKERSPDTVRMLLTGYSEIDVTISAINHGNIFRFLTKPCPKDRLKQAIDDGLRQFRLVRGERELLEGTLKGSVKVLSDVLGLINPVAFGHASRVNRIAMGIADHIGVENAWEIEIASMMSLLGCVGVPHSIMEKRDRGETLTEEEQDTFDEHPMLGSNLLANIPRLDSVAEIVENQNRSYESSGSDHVSGDAISLGARVLKVAGDFDSLEVQTGDPIETLKELRHRRKLYDPSVLDALEVVIDEMFSLQSQALGFTDLRVGMILSENVTSETGQLLVAKGHEVTESVLGILRNFHEKNNLGEPLQVLVGG